ncbi:DUF819 family protein [Elongatibacter sediminis]|uniref:DUF819 family protein n=1 Tax=Elongatibacter sediminis TaxID=3119006 RepID=A0AAW9RH73_9GAMM
MDSVLQAPMTVFTFLAGVCAAIYWSTQQPWGKRFFEIVPPVLLVCYIPAICTNLGLIPARSEAYEWMRDYLLPMSLFLLIVGADVPSVLKVGKKAIIVMLFGTLGVVIGAPVSLLLFQDWLPPDIWKGMAAISGSWIGGGANFAALKESVDAPDGIAGAAIIVDATITFTWLGVMLYLAKFPNLLDRFYASDTRTLEELDRRFSDFKEATQRMPTMVDFIIMVALGLGAAVFCGKFAETVHPVLHPMIESFSMSMASVFSQFTWLILMLTTLGIAASFTPLRKMEQAGSSTFGFAALYLFFTSLGAQADLARILDMPIFLLVGIVWLFIHVCFLLLGAWLTKAPFFLVAVGSEANLGGYATAPVVASAFYRSMAPVGLLLSIFGGVIGTYCGLLAAFLLRTVAN